MLATRPAARPTLALLQFLLGSANASLARLLLLGVGDPADELVACQWRDVPPRGHRGVIAYQRGAQVDRQFVHDTTWHPGVGHPVKITRAGYPSRATSTSSMLVAMRTGPEAFGVRGADGVRIAADRVGDPEAPAVVFLHGGGQTRRSWSRVAAAVADRGWQAVTVDFRGHGESDWSDDGDYRLTTFAGDVVEVMRQLPPRPVLVGASLGGLTSMLLAGELSPGSARAIVLVDIVPNMNPEGTARIHDFMYDRMTSGFDSLDEVADAIAAYNPHRPRPEDLDGLRTNLRHRGGRWYWHWDPKFIDGTSAFPPTEVNDAERLHAAVEAILRDGVPMLLVRGQVSDLVTRERADEFLARFPDVEFVDVGGAGHMVAGDRNDVFADAVMGFLARHAITD